MFTLDAFVPRDLPVADVVSVPPAIDALSPKNIALPDAPGAAHCGIRDEWRRGPVTRADDQRVRSAVHPGDLARRLVARRAELGLSVTAVARRTGMDPGYLQHLEEHADVPTREALIRLADALETTPGHLLGDASA